MQPKLAILTNLQDPYLTKYDLQRQFLTQHQNTVQADSFPKVRTQVSAVWDRGFPQHVRINMSLKPLLKLEKLTIT